MDWFLKALSVCHGVIPTWDEHKNEFLYESQSPDETALLVAARTNGYSLINRSKQAIQFTIQGVSHSYELLTTIEFNSTRKRMSVIVRTPEGIRVYCKGADNIMMARMDQKRNKEKMMKEADEALTKFSNIGLRTLVVGYRDLSESQYQDFKKQFEEAEISLEMREELLDQASEMVENEFILLGCTAIEDKLQDQLPETIENLLKADIKLWLLTGDKQETAVNIGLSSRLINKTMRLLLLNAATPEAAESAMDVMIAEQEAAPPSQVFAMVVDGHVLSLVFAGAEKSKGKFLSIGTRCKTVICARVTPLQKALVVRLVRRSLKSSITLAIGDGANDVSMIQEAHVGVGIMGKEGTQAVRAADYAFGEFKYLQRLLTVHGRFQYLRMSGIILFSFYKNFVFIVPQWYFGFVNAWSGQVISPLTLDCL
jgi:phospholipid-transporting ATPase